MGDSKDGDDVLIPVWTQQIPDDQWAVYAEVIQAARAANIDFSLGGAFALATYTDHWRNTKDLDFYVQPQDRERMMEVVTEAGLIDLYDELPYVRSWIYRAHREDIIVDIIWAMANSRTDVDARWIQQGPQISIRGEVLKVVPVEEMIWGKLYILQKDRCDWPDAFNMISSLGQTMDWEHLLHRVEDDAPLLSSLMGVFSWICPGRAASLPNWLWDRLNLPEPKTNVPTEVNQRCVSLLDTRDWFHDAPPTNSPYP